MGTHPIFESDFDCLTEKMGPLQLLFGLINFIICVGGIALVAVSSWLLINPESFFDVLETTSDQINGQNTTLPQELLDFLDQIDSGLWLTLVGAIILLLIGFLGCCGAFRKSACMLNTYAFVMVISILLQIAAAAVVFFYSSDVTNVVVTILDKYDPNVTDDDGPQAAINQFVDNLQNGRDCCGWEGPQDYKTNEFLNPNSTDTFTLPSSCCVTDNSTATCTTTSTDIGEACSASLRGMGWALGGVLLGIVFVEILATVGACYVKKNDKNFA